ncbi:hypothetical protein HanPSC8_Chr16g0706341 [Helianthus annuus]|nr:hypothetical protein HanPSC8_Chr16g0706341 [Helianthus annuus]
MGSLMAGWNSHVRHLQLERNRSLTKEEIARFWRSKKIKRKNFSFLKLRIDTQRKIKYVRDESELLPPSLLVREEEIVEPTLKKHGWWICSKCAFLNEPPYMSWETSYNYVAQFHIACKHIDEQ